MQLLVIHTASSAMHVVLVSVLIFDLKYHQLDVLCHLYCIYTCLLHLRLYTFWS